MKSENSRAADEARIHEIIEERVSAICAKDVDTLMSEVP